MGYRYKHCADRKDLRSNNEEGKMARNSGRGGAGRPNGNGKEKDKDLAKKAGRKSMGDHRPSGRWPTKSSEIKIGFEN